MRYFLPDLYLATELPRQTQLEEKLGGLPWGLPPVRWPRCTECGHSQSLLAQFVHHSDRLDLGKEGRVLFVFQCNHDPGMCSNWEGGSGANACFVVEPDELTSGLTPLPADSPMVETEARILRWLEKDDGITPEQAKALLKEETVNLSEDAHLPEYITRLGSVPNWIQNPDEAPGDDWQFIGQLDNLYSFFTPPLITGGDISPDPNRLAGRTHVCQGPNFGDCGIGYLFLRKAMTGPEGWFFWQCS